MSSPAPTWTAGFKRGSHLLRQRPLTSGFMKMDNCEYSAPVKQVISNEGRPAGHHAEYSRQMGTAEQAGSLADEGKTEKETIDQESCRSAGTQVRQQRGQHTDM